jgi:hypothetical protein
MKAATIMAALATLAATPVASAEGTLVPLSELLAQPGNAKDPVVMGYVMERCGAFYTVFAANLEGETAPDRLEVQRQSTVAAANFISAAITLMQRGTTMDTKEAGARVNTITTALAKRYVEIFASVRLANPNLSSDPMLAGDVATCRSLLPLLNASPASPAK